MDYEVFLLSRIKEEWDRSDRSVVANTAAVATGLERTGRTRDGGSGTDLDSLHCHRDFSDQFHQVVRRRHGAGGPYGRHVGTRDPGPGVHAPGGPGQLVDAPLAAPRAPKRAQVQCQWPRVRVPVGIGPPGGRARRSEGRSLPRRGTCWRRLATRTLYRCGPSPNVSGSQPRRYTSISRTKTTCWTPSVRKSSRRWGSHWGRPRRIEGSPLERLIAQGRAYVRFALEKPEHYRLAFMISGEPRNVDDVLSNSCFVQVLATVQECMDAGIFPPDPDGPMQIGLDLWSAAHGLASLLIYKPWFPWGEVDEVVERVFRASVTGCALSRRCKDLTIDQLARHLDCPRA